VCAALPVNAQHEVPQIPLEAFFRTPQLANVQVSPGGRWLAWLSPHANRQNLFVAPTQGGASQRITAETDRDIADYTWKNDEWILFSKDSAGNENFHLYAARLDGSATRCLTPFAGARAAVLDPLPQHPTDVLITLNKRDPRWFDVYRLNVITGELAMVLENPSKYTSYLVDHLGRLRVAVATDGVNTTLYHRPDESSPFAQVLSTSFREAVTPVNFTPGNDSLYVLSNRGRDRKALATLCLRTGAESSVVYEHPQADLSAAVYSPHLRRIAMLRVIFQLPESEYWAETWKMAYKLTAQQFGALSGPDPDFLTVANTDTAERVFVLRSYSDRSQGAYYIYDAVSRTARKLDEVAPWLNRTAMARMKPIEIPSRDGFTLHSYLTLPTGQEGAQGLPLVLMVHGGPWARDVWGFNPQVQFLANRGYAVLQVNYRGSTGYGRKFWEASFKQWGLRMQDDLTDAVRWAIRQGIADSNRICIYGGSYGGYATLAGACLTPNLYCCAVDVVGVSNLFTFMNTIPPYWTAMREMLYEMVGNPTRADSVQMRRTSPVFLADSIRIPMLIAQGGQDPRVNRAESEQMIAALRGRNVPVHYFLREDEGHGFRNEENRMAFYRTMEEFLAQYLRTPLVQRGADGRWKPLDPARVRHSEDTGRR
jgi:dipeptidyl aminopeptidase/acylaminoacyl peptidase